MPTSSGLDSLPVFDGRLHVLSSFDFLSFSSSLGMTHAVEVLDKSLLVRFFNSPSTPRWFTLGN